MIGTVFSNRFGTKAEVIEYKNYKNVTVRFLDEHKYVGVYRLCHLKEGNFKNPYDKLFSGVGYCGELLEKLDGDSRSLHGTWRHMLERCYDTKSLAYPRYGGRGIYVEESWHNFQNFLSWARKERRLPNWHLDKDIRSTKGKFYGPDTCCFVPPEINAVFTNLEIVNGKPVGVHKTNYGSFAARLGIGNGKSKHLGVFEDQLSASNAYKLAKESYVKSLAFKWEESIDKKVFQVLISWTFDKGL